MRPSPPATRRLSVALLAMASVHAGSDLAVAAPCDEAILRDLRAPATGAEHEVVLETACDITLRSGEILTKRLIFQGAGAAGATLDCNGATLNGGAGQVNAGRDMIEVRSRKTGPRSWSRPERVAIRNCTVLGSIRVFGVGKNGEADDNIALSRCTGIDEPTCRNHTRRVQDAAPRGTVFRGIRVVGQGRNPFYLAPGVTATTLERSEITGQSGAVGIYLDAESADNVIRNNTIHVTTGNGRSNPQLALDGSARNIIAGNRFSALNRGGIFLYRNCGEAGAVRHQPPQYNRIINNVFFYDKFTGDTPAIFLGSRQGNRSYCHEDSAFPFGSGKSDRDFARHNIIADNRIVKRSVADMIRTTDDGNAFHGNVTVTADAASVRRDSACHVFDILPRADLGHGAKTVLEYRDGEPGCAASTTLCLDGLAVTRPGQCAAQNRYAAVDFGCGVEGDNAGARCVASCPEGFRILAARAACNLEADSLSRIELARQGWGTLGVFRSSDDVSRGHCRLGGVSIRRDVARLGQFGMAASLQAACRDHDENGGDCRIAGTLVCVRPSEHFKASPGSVARE